MLRCNKQCCMPKEALTFSDGNVFQHLIFLLLYWFLITTASALVWTQNYYFLVFIFNFYILALGTARSLADQRVVARQNHLLALACHSPRLRVASTSVYIFSWHAVGAAALTLVCSVYASIINLTATSIYFKIFFRLTLEFLIKFLRCFKITLYAVTTSLIGFYSLFWLFDYFCRQYIQMSVYIYKYACSWLQNLSCHAVKPKTCRTNQNCWFFEAICIWFTFSC